MSFGFAVGDFLAVTKLIVEISESLKDSTGSARQFQHLLLELDNLRHALHEVDKLTADGPPELLTTITAINVTALSCRLPLAQFLEGIRKYEASLGLGCSAGKFKDMNMRVKWALGKQKAVDELRKELCAHVGSINMLLGLYQVKCTRLSFSGQARIANQIGIVNQRIMAIQTSVAQSNDYMFDTQQDTKSTLRQVTEVLVPNVQDLCDISRKIWSVNLETFNILRRLPDLSISPDTRFTYLQAPVQFEDAIGRTFPIPLEFSWEMLEAAICARFNSGPGRLRVERGEYEIFESSDSKKIVSKARWPTLVPGKRITMAIVLGTHRFNKAQCPIRDCRSSVIMDAPHGGKICPCCNVWFDNKQSSHQGIAGENLPSGCGIGDKMPDADVEVAPVKEDERDCFRNIRLLTCPGKIILLESTLGNSSGGSSDQWVCCGCGTTSHLSAQCPLCGHLKCGGCSPGGP